LNHQFGQTIRKILASPGFILGLGAALALGLFLFACELPKEDRVNGDIIGYLAITARFGSLGDAFAYVGNRTYGYPLFVYLGFLSRSWLGLANTIPWLTWVCSLLLAIHLGAALAFYRFFLRDKFLKAGLPRGLAAFSAALVMCYPGLVAHTATPLTDTLSTDLLMVAAALYCASRQRKGPIAFAQASLCGLVLGYAIMVRPSFWPAVLAFYGASLIEAAFPRANRSQLLASLLSMVIGTLALILPALEAGSTAYNKPCLQNPKFVEACSATCIQLGLYSVRVFWSVKVNSKESLPGVRDPFLWATFGKDSGITTPRRLLGCLCSKPAAIPLYFAKKTMALFDAPFLHPYAIDKNPAWFPSIQRLFELGAFCGFIGALFWAAGWFFYKERIEFVEWPWLALISVLLLTHLIMHIEGRYGFPLIPFSIASLFLSYAQMRKAGPRLVLAWTLLLLGAAAVFFWQVRAWDAVIPV
jgi:hypothetical protein